MPTTNANFVDVSKSGLAGGATVKTAPFLQAMHPKVALDAEVGSSGTVVDVASFNLGLSAVPAAGDVSLLPRHRGQSVGGFAKNGATLLTLVTTTAQTIDLTDLTSGPPTATAGDTAFATVNAIIFRNLGNTDLVLSPGASNPSNFPKFGGTTPTLTIPANSVVALQSAAGVTVDSTHKTFTVTPSSGGTLAVSVGGA